MSEPVTALQHDSLAPSFWDNLWQTGQAFWHQQSVNEALLSTVHRLDAIKESITSSGRRPRMFVPLCGATVDMAYFISQGWDVIGLDAIQQPLRDFVEKHKDQLTNVRDVPTKDGIVHIAADHLDLFAVDLFSDDVNSSLFGGLVDAIWDRGSFVAIGLQQRSAYVAKLMTLLNKSDKPNWLLNAFDYNMDSAFQAPPHRLPRDTLDELIKEHASSIEEVEKKSGPPKFKDVVNLKYMDSYVYAITISK